MKFNGRRKFKAKWTEDSAGVKHRSAGEARWYDRLRLREKAGEISHLVLEPAWDITINGEHICKVSADASYFDEAEGKRHTVDFKGIEGETPLSKLKRKLVKAQHGVEIEVVGPAKAREDRKREKAAWVKAEKKKARDAAKAAKAEAKRIETELQRV
jgi:hypothetical protein